MTNDFYSAVKARRTVYNLSKTASIPDERIEVLVQEALKHAPSSFNSQSGRVILLLGKSHDELWDGLKETLRGYVKDPAAYADSVAKVDGFKGGYGTVLFFEDQATVRYMQENYALYATKFPDWSNHSSGMVQFIVWTSLAAEGMGASLQHYSPLVDEWVQKKTGAPADWKLIAQMPFGVPSVPAGEKSFNPLEGRYRTIR